MSQDNFKNYSTWKVAITIDNDSKLNLSVLKGMGACVRRFLGQPIGAASHPFVTCFAPMPKQHHDIVPMVNEVRRSEFLKAGNNVDAGSVLGISISSSFLSNLSQSIKRSDNEDGLFKEAEIDHKQITQHLINRHWDNVLQKIQPAMSVSSGLSL